MRLKFRNFLDLKNFAKLKSREKYVAVKIKDAKFSIVSKKLVRLLRVYIRVRGFGFQFNGCLTHLPELVPATLPWYTGTVFNFCHPLRSAA